jgi:hypothetical protein
MIIRVMNTSKNFPTAYSFIKSKAKILFDFVFNYLRRFIFIDIIAEA